MWLAGTQRPHDERRKGFLPLLDELLERLVVHVEHGRQERAGHEVKDAEGQEIYDKLLGRNSADISRFSPFPKLLVEFASSFRPGSD